MIYKAPILAHNGNKQREEIEPYYQIPQALADAIFSVLGNSSAQLRIMLVLIGTKPGFGVSQKWILQRTGLKEKSYIEARKALVARGWLTHTEYDSIIVNINKIYSDGEEKNKDAELPATIAGKKQITVMSDENEPATIAGERHNTISGKEPAMIADIINKEQNKINNNIENEQQQEKVETICKEPIIISREKANYLEQCGNKLEWINENDFYLNGCFSRVQDIVI